MQKVCVDSLRAPSLCRLWKRQFLAFCRGRQLDSCSSAIYGQANAHNCLNNYSIVVGFFKQKHSINRAIFISIHKPSILSHAASVLHESSFPRNPLIFVWKKTTSFWHVHVALHQHALRRRRVPVILSRLPRIRSGDSDDATTCHFCFT